MTDPRAAEVELNRALWAIVNERFTDSAAAELWAKNHVAWGLFGIPDEELKVLGDVRGRQILELASGTSYFSAWLSRAGAHVVALDFSAEQLATGQVQQLRRGPEFPLVQADVERLPLADQSFDIVVSEHGAPAWGDPERWLPEAARVLRPGGRLVFLTNSHLSALCVPAEEGVAEEHLVRGQRDAYRVRWPGGGVEFHPSHGDWIRLLRQAGFDIVAMHEIYAPPDSADHEYYEIVTAEWASKWPAEELWVARRWDAENRRGRAVTGR